MSRCLPLAAILCLIAAAASAHTRSESWSEWVVSGEAVRGVVTVPAREVTRLPDVASAGRPLAEIFSDYLAERVVVETEERPCRLEDVHSLAAQAGFVRVELAFGCDHVPVAATLPVLFDQVQGHTHFARHAGTLREAVLTEAAHRFHLTAGSAGGSFSDYFRLGVGHILSGADHIAFLLALLLAAAHWRNILIAVTGFTIGHSVTLSLAVTGWVQASPPRVEAFIGYTIALVAAETVALRNGYWRGLAIAAVAVAAAIGIAASAWGGLDARGLLAYAGLGVFSGCYLALAGELDDRIRRGRFLGAVAVLFGLVHGLGFAGFLLQTGLPDDAVLVPLAAFNIGVEAGQLAIVAAMLAAGLIVRRSLPGNWPALAQMFFASALCGLGLAWFAGRSLG